jgi:hypothetical protein
MVLGSQVFGRDRLEARQDAVRGLVVAAVADRLEVDVQRAEAVVELGLRPLDEVPPKPAATGMYL